MVATLAASLLREQPDLRRDPRELHELEVKNKYLGGEIYGVNGMKTRRRTALVAQIPLPES